MLNTNKIQVLVINNPFDREDVTTVEIEAENKTLRTLFEDVATECLVALNGKVVDEKEWNDVMPKMGDRLAISVVPAGGEGGDGKTILRLAAMIALTYFTMGAGGAFFTAANFGGSAGLAFAAQSAAFIGGSMLINKVLPPTMASLPDQSLAASPSQTYGIDGAKNTSRESLPIPLCFGGYNMAGNIINTRTANDGDSQRLFVLLNAGEGEVKGIKDIRINGELAESFDAKVVTRNGTNNQEVIEDFTDASNDTTISQTLEDTGDDITLTTTTPSSNLEVDVSFQQGLYRQSTKTGKYTNDNVKLLAGYKKASADDNIWYILREERSLPCIRVTVTNQVKLRSLGQYFFSLSRIDYIEGINTDLSRFTHFLAPLNRIEVQGGGEEDPREEYDREEEEFYDVIGVLPNGDEVLLGEYNAGDLRQVENETCVKLSGNSPSPLRFTMKSPPIDLDNYEMFIYRKTPKPDNTNPDRPQNISNAMTVTQFRQFRGVDGIAYNHTALIGVSVTVDNQLNSMPTITYYNEGMLIPVYRRNPDRPSEFIMTMEASSNPAWIVHAMYTNKRWGAKKAHSALVMEEFYEWAQLCDEKGWQFKGVFDAEMNIFDAARAVAKIGHAKIIPIGTQYGVNVQHKQQMVQIFNSSMIVKDSFETSWLPTTDRANVIDCTFYDKNNYNKPRTFRYYNDELIESGAEFRPAELNLFGVDNVTQATKECIFALNYNQLAQTVSFDAPASAISCRLGQVIGVQHELPAWGVGGLLSTGSTDRMIKLDRAITMEADKEYAVLVHFNSKRLEDLAVTKLTSDVYTLSTTSMPNTEANRIVIDDKDSLKLWSSLFAINKNYATIILVS